MGDRHMLVRYMLLVLSLLESVYGNPDGIKFGATI